MLRVKWSSSEITSLIPLAALVACTLLVRFYSGLYAYVVLIVASILVFNFVFLLPTGFKYGGLIGVFSGYALFAGLLGALGKLEVGDYIVDLVYVVVLLVVLTLYHYNTTISNVLTALTPVVLLVSVITGIYLGLADPLRYAVLVLLDTFSAIIVLTSVKNHAVELVSSLLVFTLLYSTPFLALSAKVLTVLFTLYILKALLVIYNKMRELRLLVSVDLLLRPLLVTYL